MGDTQPLANGNVFVGWGSEPYFSEYSRSGKLLFEGELPGPNLTYRATLEQWVGLPLTPPVGAARRTDGRSRCTRAGTAPPRPCPGGFWPDPAAPAGCVLWQLGRKSGFETAIPVPRDYTSFKVQALDADGKAIGTSRPFA